MQSSVTVNVTAPSVTVSASPFSFTEDILYPESGVMVNVACVPLRISAFSGETLPPAPHLIVTVPSRYSVSAAKVMFSVMLNVYLLSSVSASSLPFSLTELTAQFSSVVTVTVTSVFSMNEAPAGSTV